MKQPELGKILSNLRNSKGLTQEELVEKCNISVRTIQRIEAGEVTPRSYTIKTILAALGENLENFKDIFVLVETPSFSVSKKQMQFLNAAFFVGIIYFCIGFVEFYLDADLEFERNLVISTPFYVSVKVISFVSMLFFYGGFIVCGQLFKNYLLRISSLLLMILFGLATIFAIYTWFSPTASDDFLWVTLCIFIGCVLVVHGISLLRLKKHLGSTLSTITAVFVITTGATFISVLLFLLGLIFLIPVSILQLLLLYKTRELAKQSDSK